MNATVRGIAAVPRVDHAETIAAGLEECARAIREGRLEFRPDCCMLTLMRRDGDGDDVAATYFGAEISAVLIAGMLEVAKLQTLEGG